MLKFMKYKNPIQKVLAKQKEVSIRLSRFSIKITVHTYFTENDFFFSFYKTRFDLLEAEHSVVAYLA